MDTETPILDIERRAYDARVTMKELCIASGVHPSSWSRCKQLKRASVVTLRTLESKLDEIEAERKAA
jgi:hypothetical protein